MFNSHIVEYHRYMRDAYSTVFKQTRRVLWLRDRSSFHALSYLFLRNSAR